MKTDETILSILGDIAAFQTKLKTFQKNLLKKLLYDESSRSIDNIDDFALFLESSNLKDVTIKKYYSALDVMQEKLCSQLSIELPYKLTSVNSSNLFKTIIDLFESEEELITLNLSWHHMISAAYNNYYKFLKSKGL